MNYLIYNRHGEYLTELLEEIETESMRPVHSAIETGGDFREKMGEFGSVFIGDAKQSKRDFTLKFAYANGKPRDLDARIVINEIGAFFSEPEEDGDFWIEDIENQIRAKVMTTTIDPKTGEGLENRIIDGEMKFRLLDALWENSKPNIEIFPLNNEEFKEFSLPSYSVAVKPILEIKALNPNPDFAIDIGRLDKATGEFRGSQSVRIQQINFNTDDLITIDCVDGKALHKKAGTDIVSENKFMMTDGGWMSIGRRDRAVRYQGTGSIELTLKFRPRFYI
ncbi:hypothetical protein EHQ12_04000 [Leptospira gomenensis]|uniref:Phage tail protein n=1 Tax=Leptospira gomenensis TaxID=2484974 RepID=A0A5F1YH42_9LEPT|nr:hypothetical protein [Leptospira gomenensis]TGK36164.1 hypothetical protein EHQ17_04410 [Leptospira gomenensis]TGK42796.1 hypothetical protein EHQ07_14080 [Leptospira gomenensis]TGK42929.1 hypothetical protein EHQ12_04000 [Leptospira gomenensis]TGK54941.1 hypothetical protein EHQ13_18255 [Leptospira gomenensis]